MFEEKDKVDVKKVEKETAKVSFLTAFFEKRENYSNNPKQITPKTRRKRKTEKSMELKNQRKIDTFLIDKESMQKEKPTPVKRKIKEVEISNLGTPCTPEKARRLGERKKTAVYREPVWEFNLE